MANISSAFGTISIKGTQTQVELIMNLLEKYASHWEYNICLDSPSVQPFIPNEKNIVEYIGSFTGLGRWTFSNNVRNLFNWLNESILFEDDAEEIAVWQKFLSYKEQEISLTFDFIDVEGGCDVLCQEVLSIKIHPEEMGGGDVSCFNFNPFTASVVEELKFESYDFTAENLVLLGMYNEGTVFDNSTWGIKSALSSLVMKYQEQWVSQWSKQLANQLQIELDQILNLPSMDLPSILENDDRIFYDLESWLFDNEMLDDAIRGSNS